MKNPRVPKGGTGAVCKNEIVIKKFSDVSENECPWYTKDTL